MSDRDGIAAAQAAIRPASFSDRLELLTALKCPERTALVNGLCREIPLSTGNGWMSIPRTATRTGLAPWRTVASEPAANYRAGLPPAAN